MQVFGANKPTTRTRTNNIDAKNLKATAFRICRLRKQSQLLGLDVSAVGGMYANRFTMVGTEAGVGVNL